MAPAEANDDSSDMSVDSYKNGIFEKKSFSIDIWSAKILYEITPVTVPAYLSYSGCNDIDELYPHLDLIEEILA